MNIYQLLNHYIPISIKMDTNGGVVATSCW